MFKGSRRRTMPVQPLTKETADPNAATAAASAFMRHGPSQSLSSAAAAAALRARPNSPTNVANVQSKRIQRRSSSVSSVTSRDGKRKGELQRTPSVGSMIERTFRTPSPGRSPVARTQNVPPIPNVHYTEHISGFTNVEKGCGNRLQTQPFQTASQKVKNRQGSWFAAATSQELIPDFSSLSNFPEQRSGSVSPSINFSYPRSRTLPQLAASSSPTSNQELVYDANSRRMVPRTEFVARSLSIGDFPRTPIKVKKKKRTEQDFPKSGPYVSKGSITKTKIGPVTHSFSGMAPIPLDPHQYDQASSMGSNKDADLKSHVKKPVTTSPAISSLPDKEEETHEEIQNGQYQPNIQAFDINEPLTQPAASSTKSGEQLYPDIDRLGVESESSIRSTRFASPADQSIVKHEPPPRSLSPRKSAMKLSNSTRGLSPAPSNDGSEASGFDSSQRNKDDAAIARKKSVRVSWDDKNTVVVGEAAQPPETDASFIPSPQGKKPSHIIIGGYPKRDGTSLDGVETMSPRPALPLFGSMREKKPREQEERPLVRPYEMTWSNTCESGALHIRAPMSTQGLVQSLGVKAPQGQSSKNIANISKYREPLPPIFVTREVTSDDSDDSLGSEDGDVQNLLKSGGTGAGTQARQRLDNSTLLLRDVDEGDSKNTGTFSTSISHSIHNQGSESVTLTTMRTAVSIQNPNSKSGHKAPHADNTLALISPILAQPTGSPVLSPVLQMNDIKEEEEEDSDQSSIYSDAYEDLSEVEGNGFISLNAVLEAPSSVKSLPEVASRESLVFESHFKNLQQGNEDWEKAKAYWKSLTSDERRLLEREALEEGHENASPDKSRAIDNKTMNDLEPSKQNGQTQQVNPRLQGSDNESKNVLHETLLDGTGGQKSKTMKKPVSIDNRDAEPTAWEDTHLGSTPGSTTQAKNVSQVEIGMRKSLGSKTSETDEAQYLRPSPRSTTGRPASYHYPLTAEEPNQHYPNHPIDGLVPHSNTMAASNLTSKWKRRGSDSSESSFTRSRTGTAPRPGFRFSMRESMRETVSSDRDKAGGRFSLRSLSPAGSNLRRNSISSMPTPGTRMHQSMRQGSSHLRSPHIRMASLGLPSVKNMMKPKGSSRFTDSSDEDDDHPALFRSRFVDSSDEEDATISKTKDKGLSKSFLSKATNTVAEANSSAPHRKSQKGTLPGTVSSRHIHNSSIASASTQHHSNTKNAVPSTRAQSHKNPELELSQQVPSHRGGFISILRRKGDPTSRNPQLLNQNATPNDSWRGMTQSNEVPSQRTSWPLPEHGDTDANDSDTLYQSPALDKHRPSTTDGLQGGAALKSAFFSEQHNPQGLTSLNPIDSESALDLTHKKKKFGVLRKMFRLQD